MTLHQLRIFVAVAKHLNVTRASRELRVTQPSLSRQLKLLADECGVGLYRVNSRGVELTPEGRLLLSNVEPILSGVENVEKIFRCVKSDIVLCIGGSHSPSLSLLPLLSAAFKKNHPDVQIVIRTESSQSLEQLVLKSEVELAVLINPSYCAFLSYEPCRQERWAVFSSIKHPLARRPRMTLAELSRAPLVIERKRPGEGNETERILRQIEEGGLKPNIVMQCDSPEAIKVAVKAGLGLAVLHRDAAEPELKTGDLKMIKISDLKLEIDSFVVYPKERPLSLCAQSFLGLLRQRARWAMGYLRLA